MEKVKVGENISIACVAIGSPMPYVKWRRGKTTELSPEDKLPVGRNVLNLTNVEVSDNYTCIAASSLGMIEATTFIKVLSKFAVYNISCPPSLPPLQKKRVCSSRVLLLMTVTIGEHTSRLVGFGR